MESGEWKPGPDLEAQRTFLEKNTSELTLQKMFGLLGRVKLGEGR